MRFICVLLLFFTGFTFAENYAWYANSQFTGPSYSDPLQGCIESHAAITDLTGWFISKKTETMFACGAMRNGQGLSAGAVYRKGDSCPSGATLDPLTGECKKPDLCKAREGEVFHGSVNTLPDDYAPDVFSNEGCEAVFTGKTICKILVSNNDIGNCNGPAKFTGNTLEADGPLESEGKDCSKVDCSKDDPQPESSNDPCVPTPTATGTTCTSETNEENPSTVNCDYSSGAPECIEDPKGSSKNTKTTTTTTSVANVDGSTTTTTAHATTTTTCSGVGNCQSGNSVSTSTGGKNPDGSTKPTTTTCTGYGCGTSGGGTPGGTPGGGTTPGGGNGDGDGGADNKYPMLNKLNKPDSGLGIGMFQVAEDSMVLKTEETKTLITAKIGEIKLAFMPIADMQLSGGGVLYCPPPITILGQSIDFCIDKYANSLSWIASAVLAMCAVISLMIVFG